MPDYTNEDIEYMKMASLLCDNAQCGYKVGCVVVKEEKVVIEAWNERLPGNQFCNYGTCVREEENLKGGKNIDRVCTIHAEQVAIAEAAKSGRSLDKSSMYVTTYPCLICAKSIAKSGVSRLYYMCDYMGENFADEILSKAGVTVVNIPQSVCWN